MNNNDLSYCELRAKEVVNSADGKRMGRIVDILFSRNDGTVSGIVVPLCKKSVFSKAQDIFIPWRCVCKIGEDVILVNLTVDASGRVTCSPKEPPGGGDNHHHHREKHEHSRGCDNDECEQACDDTPPPSCDYRCEKCMLFDCAYRWSHMN